MYVKQEFIINRVNKADLRTGVCSLAQAMADNGLVLARITADHQRRIDGLQCSHGLTQCGTGWRIVLVGEIHLSQAVINIVHAQPTGKRLQQ